MKIVSVHSRDARMTIGEQLSIHGQCMEQKCTLKLSEK
jgi:hypothetical protein